MTHEELARLSALELAAQFKSRALSPVAATQAALERMDAWEPHINAMYLISREAALSSARASEARWAQRAPLSALDGVPVTIKENIYTAGDPAPIGTAAMDLTPKTMDAPPAARCREAGLVILGKTTMPDYGMLSSGRSSIHGTTRNPWDLSRNTSGSSSGACAACVAGYGPLHLGTDIGGSVRLPATHGGFFALKPSLGRVPVNPPFMGRVTGPMTRSVADSAALMNILKGVDTRDYMSLPPDATDYLRDLDALNLKGLRIGLLTDMGVGLPVNAEVRAASEACASALANAGAQVTPMKSYLSEAMLDGMTRFFEARMHNELEQISSEARAKVLPFIVEWAYARAPRMSGREVMAAYNQVMNMREAAVASVAQFDFVISPVSPILPYEAESCAPGDDPANALPHIAFTVAYNMSEQPAASVNWAASVSGLPIGVQVVGQRFDDVGVLRLSRALEKLRPAQKDYPKTPTGRAS